jgi:hypothetical protein
LAVKATFELAPDARALLDDDPLVFFLAVAVISALLSALWLRCAVLLCLVPVTLAPFDHASAVSFAFLDPYPVNPNETAASLYPLLTPIPRRGLRTLCAPALQLRPPPRLRLVHATIGKLEQVFLDIQEK